MTHSGLAVAEPLPRPPVLGALEALDGANVRYVVLRGIDQLWCPSHVNEVDLLIVPEEIKAATSALQAIGYLELPAFGHAPHRFFANYYPEPNEWVKLDIVTALMYGRPTPHLSVDHELCIRNRVRRRQIFVPDAGDEFAMLLLHCLLDKRDFRTHDRARLECLHDLIARRGIGFCSLLWQIDEALPWRFVSVAIGRRDYDRLLNCREDVQRSLLRHEAMIAPLRQARNVALRRLRPTLAAFRAHGISVALVAPDGAGKTTLARRLVETSILRGRYQYMGRSADAQHRGPKAWRFVRRQVRRWAELARARALALTGAMVIFDRFSYDRWAADPPTTALGRIREWLLRTGWPTPDVTVVLDAPGTVLFARKGEHSPTALERQRQIFRKVATTVPHATLLDVTKPLEVVERELTSLVWNCYKSRRAKR